MPYYCWRGWFTANNWWERSPNLSSSANFNNVTNNGNAGNSNNASNVNGVVPRFFPVIVTMNRGEIITTGLEGEYNLQNGNTFCKYDSCINTGVMLNTA